MGKDNNFTGQPVYNQVLNLLDKDKILKISRETRGSEAYVKRFDGYQHLLVMLLFSSCVTQIASDPIFDQSV